MSLAITIELGDADVQRFAETMQRAEKNVRGRSAEDIVGAASKLLELATVEGVPSFIRERLDALRNLIDMVRDQGFALPDEDRQRVLACLAYFADADDLIHDSVPVLGFLDDAIMIELCQRELKHEIEAYADFVDFRNHEAHRLGVDPATLATQRVDWAEARRVELIDRMRRRRRDGYANVGGWSPVLFRVG